MPKNKEPIALAPLERILKENGAIRVSDDALVEFSGWLTEYAQEISKRAIAISKNSNRKTILEEDMILAISEIRKKYGF
jgi:histone H3/H4